jgi:hypothetical protein
MIGVGITGQADREPRITKFVITGFADIPRPGFTTCYAEVCATADDPFLVLLPSNAQLTSKHELYFDDETCSRLLSEYDQADPQTGRHRQRVGDELLEVLPAAAKVSTVAPPADHAGTAFRVSLPREDENDNRLRGTWLVWTHPADTKLMGRAAGSYNMTLSTTNAQIDHFYLFLVLPLGHEAVNPLCHVGSTRSIGGERPTNPVHRFRLEPPFPVFPEWRDWIYGREVLRTRDDFALRSQEEAVLQLQTRSELLQGRISARAYATGLMFALSTNVLTTAVFFVKSNGLHPFGYVAVALGAGLSAGSAFIGWKSLSQQR